MLVHVVDDSTVNCEIFAAVAERVAPDIRATTFTDPKDGLAASVEALPDLVVLDYMMPEIDGHEYARRFRALPGAKAVPIVMITAATDRAIRHAALEIGVTDFLTKPIDRQEMKARIANLLALRRAHLNLQDRSRWLADEVRKATEKVLHQADHDALTSLPNRACFLRHLAQALGSLNLESEGLAVLYLDLDGFKDVNDTWGHGAGDKVLTEVGTRLLGLLRPGELGARLGGDEFAIVQVGQGQPASAVDLAERVLACVREPFAVGSTQAELGASVGIAICPDGGEDADALMHRADVALYRAKRDGKGVFRFFDPEMEMQLRERRALERDLRLAMEDGGLEVHYQPQADAASGKIVGVEALLRWAHPQRGAVPPSVFVPVAEECGLIRALGEWVLRRACADAMTWPSAVRLGINLSPLQIRPELPRIIRRALAETGLPASRLELEITEGVLLRDTQQTIAILSEIKSIGIAIALDDFGTGYASLSYLQKFPFDRLKIDRSFVQNLKTMPEAETIIRAILAMTRSLRIATIAEGVETAHQLGILQSESCPEVQGFLVARAMDTTAMGIFLSGGWTPETIRAAATVAPPTLDGRPATGLTAHVA